MFVTTDLSAFVARRLAQLVGRKIGHQAAGSGNGNHAALNFSSHKNPSVSRKAALYGISPHSPTGKAKGGKRTARSGSARNFPDVVSFFPLPA
jgi:hypothetical protein